METKTQEVSLMDRASDFGGESTRSYTREGFLRVTGRAARSGIQNYYGFELGLKDEAFKMKAVYRPPSVVLSDGFCKKFKGVDVTTGHPKEWINAKNYRAISSGVVLGDARIDDANPNFILVDMLIKDADAIKAVEAGTVGLSVGYRSVMDFTPGTTPEGEHYDASVTDVPLVNHVALVKRPRAGFDARVLDAEGGEMKTIKVGTTEIDVGDEIATVIEEHLKTLETRACEAEDSIKLKDEAIGSLNAQIEGLKKDLELAKSQIMTDEDIKAILEKADGVRAQAKQIAGEAFVCDSLDPLEIMKAAVVASGSKVNLADQSADFVKGFFEAAVASAKQQAEKNMNDSQKSLADALQGHQKAHEAMKTPDALHKEKVSEAYKQ